MTKNTSSIGYMHCVYYSQYCCLLSVILLRCAPEQVYSRILIIINIILLTMNNCEANFT